MKPAPFEYLRATSIEQVVGYLGEFGSDARLLAGGQSLVRLMNMRLATPRVIIDINGVVELDRIESDGSTVIIGALTRQRASETSDVVQRHIPLLAEAGHNVAHIPIRERGTVVGSVAFADPSAELPAALMALDGQVIAAGPEGRRIIEAEEFFVGPWQNSLSPAEIVVELRLPHTLAERTGSAFVEVSRRHGELPVGGVATVVSLSENNTIERVRIALCAVDKRPVRARQTEEVLVGQVPSNELLRAAAEMVSEGLEPIADCHGSAEFRRHISRVLAGRALQKSVSRAGREMSDA